MNFNNHMRGKMILANGFHMPTRNKVDVLKNVVISVETDGRIKELIRPEEPTYKEKLKSAENEGKLVKLPKGSFLIPGLIDNHVHASQYPQLGQALDVPLEIWLNKYTFPLEARFADIDFAKSTYSLLVDDLISMGTTTSMYYATIHQDATRILADICLEKGQRALVGKIAMDNRDQCPDYYRDKSADASIRGTSDFFDYVKAHPDNKDDMLNAVVTPRFIPSCSDAALEGLGAFTREKKAYVQTHCSEGDWEHNYVIDRFGITDTEALDKFGLLGRKSLMGHCPHLTESDKEIFLKRGTTISHCPLSNSYFASSVLPLRSALEKGIKVGLATDISGGPSYSMFEAMKSAIACSRMLETGNNPYFLPEERRGCPDSRIDFRDAFYISTTGNGEALDLPIGYFTKGFYFDAVVIDTTVKSGSIRLWDDLDIGDNILQKIVYTATRPNISTVWVGGKQIH
ncbi:MAG: guanine deaminase [Spirochaetales bacterium]|nr:guanine deaminase [Spirochaetales bacterium]